MQRTTLRAAAEPGRQTTTATGPLAIVTFEASEDFSGDAEVLLTSLSIKISGGSRDFKPGASVVLSAGGEKEPTPDFDGNGEVNFDDFFMFAAAFGQPATGEYAKFDLMKNGEVDFDDFFVFAAAFGQKM